MNGAVPIRGVHRGERRHEPRTVSCIVDADGKHAAYQRSAMNDIDWAEVLLPGTPVLEILVRGSLMYLALFALLRFVLRRETGSLGITDIVVVVLVADAAQNGMTGGYRSVPDGILLVATIVGWSYLLNLLAFRYPAWRKVIQPPRVQLVRDGRVLRHNLAHEKITEEELVAELHAHGCSGVAEVRAAWIEPDGMVSVIKHTPAGDDDGPRKKRAAP
jgi:uncharacterized membrane protein YcaP (DUF421 family)